MTEDLYSWLKWFDGWKGCCEACGEAWPQLIARDNGDRRSWRQVKVQCACGWDKTFTMGDAP